MHRIPYLSLICYLPLAGAIPILFMKDGGRVRRWATGVALADFLVSLPLWFTFERAGDLFQFRESADWIPAIGVKYEFGVDGMAVLLILLTTLLGFLSFLSSWSAIATREKEYYVFLLLLQTGMLGVFMALDFFLFYVFWEAMLVPMYFLIGIWGGSRRLYAAIKFFLYTLVGSVVMLLGILALYFYNSTGFFGIDGLGNERSFSILQFHAISDQIPLDIQVWVFLAFFVGFAIKVPMFPFHTWLPDAHVEAPTAGSVILAGVLLKMGTYGFVRFSLPILPQATWKCLPWVAALSIVAIVYGALVSMAQKDMKKLVAYSSVSHMGFVTLGLFALNPAGIAGGILQMLNHGLSTGALFLLVGVIYERRHTRMIAEYGGLSKQMPVYATIKFVLYTLVGSLLMLVAILATAFAYQSATGSWTNAFDFVKIVWIGLFIGFAIKVPMFPFHTWLPDAHTEAPTAGSVILAGVMLKLGGYGLLRFAVPLFPDAAHTFAPAI
ncbi:MAG: NADH-quinone oxidoreductase subunit M, partial [Thermoanaerobaculia bacterium]